MNPTLSSTATHPRRGRVAPRILATALVLLASTAITLAPATASDKFPCAEGTGTPTLELAWRGLAEEDDLFRTPGTTADLVVANHGTQVLFVELSASAVLDDRRETQNLGLLPVPAGGVMTIPVDLGAFGVALAGLDFSGRLSAKGVARADQGAPVAAVGYAPPVFFHEHDGNLLVYRRTVLLDQYAAGDFGNRATKLRQWIADRGLRLLGVSYYDPDLPLSDDDGGPPQDRPNQRHSHQETRR